MKKLQNLNKNCDSIFYCLEHNKSKKEHEILDSHASLLINNDFAKHKKVLYDTPIKYNHVKHISCYVVLR